MRSLILSALVSIVLLIGFGIGATGNLPGLMIAGFCLSPFLLVLMGWSLHGVFNGRRLALVEASEPVTRPSRRLSERRQTISDESRQSYEQTL